MRITERSRACRYIVAWNRNNLLVAILKLTGTNDFNIVIKGVSGRGRVKENKSSL